VLSFIRKGKDPKDDIIVVCNFTPVVRENYQIGVNEGVWKEVFNSDDTLYWGSGIGNKESLKAAKKPMHGRNMSLKLTVPPLATIMLKRVPDEPKKASKAKKK